MFTLAPAIATPPEFVTLPLILPPVASAKLSVAVFPEVTLTCFDCVKNPLVDAVTVYVPGLTLAKLYAPLAFVVVAPPLYVTFAPAKACPSEMLVTVPVIAPALPEGGGAVGEAFRNSLM